MGAAVPSATGARIYRIIGLEWQGGLNLDDIRLSMSRAPRATVFGDIGSGEGDGAGGVGGIGGADGDAFVFDAGVGEIGNGLAGVVTHDVVIEDAIVAVEAVAVGKARRTMQPHGVANVMGGAHVVAQFVGERVIRRGGLACQDDGVAKSGVGLVGQIAQLPPGAADIAVAFEERNQVSAISISQALYRVHIPVTGTGEALEVGVDLAGFLLGNLVGVRKVAGYREVDVSEGAI